MKPKYHKNQIVSIIEIWAKYVIINVKIKKVIKNKNGTYSYLIWRLNDAGEAGVYWSKRKYEEFMIFKDFKVAYNHLKSTLDDFSLQFLNTDLKPINELPSVSNWRIYFWNKKNCIFM